MGDLLVIVPSRGRPERFAQMRDAALGLAETDIRIAVATDADDPSAVAYRGSGQVVFWQGPRQTVAGWMNVIAMAEHGNYRALCSMGDDHMPRTPGWDRLLLEAIDGMSGTGIAYGDDLLQRENLPTSVVVSSDIVGALGWLALPALRHFALDNVWKDLGQGAGCLAYCPDVVIEHLHPGAGTGQWDETYASEAALYPQDDAAYYAWRDGPGRQEAVAAVTALRAAKAA